MQMPLQSMRFFPVAFPEGTSTAFLQLAFSSSTVGKSERLDVPPKAKCDLFSG